MNHLKDRIVLVTGAGGSIGSELCRQVLRQEPKKLILFDNSELALYNIDRELAAENVVAVLGDVSNDNDIRSVFIQDIDVVFHVAAYKHVTLCEKNPGPAYRVNVQGTHNILAAAAHQGTRVIFISTDKAVRPTCIMGKTKQRGEMYVRIYNQTVVRLGNVRGSSGSVLPLWKEQMAAGQPVTITRWDATRYFISSIKAAEQIIAASALQPGIYVPDMGEPKHLGYMALEMGAKEYKIIGLRPGEKLHEELFVGEKGCTNMPGIWEDAA